MSKNTFDEFSENYTSVINKALSVTGADRSQYASLRVLELKSLAQERCKKPIHRILDFGCGDGSTSAILGALFDATVVGTDTSEESLKAAASNFGSERIQFIHEDHIRSHGPFDLIYCNGVFHHIPLDQRDRVMKKIAEVLAPGGLFGLFENTPWNPGTRYVMSRIPFDADAIVVSPGNMRSIIRNSGLRVIATRYLFAIPPFLKPLFALDRYLRSAPLGAQYFILAVKTAP